MFDCNDEIDMEHSTDDFETYLILRDLELELTGSCFLSNVVKEKADIVLQAAKETGFDLYIQEEAYSENGSRVDECVAIYTRNHGKNHGPFWKRFYQLTGQVL